MTGGAKRKILIIGSTGYLGQHMVRESVSLGHPTYAYVRPIKPSTQSSKLQLHKEFEAMGVTLFQGELDDHDKLVVALKKVDVVISTLAIPQFLEQLKIIKAIKEAGNIKRFIPSEFGNDSDRGLSGLPPFEAIHVFKREIRRATEAAGIPYTYVSANSLATYFVAILLRPREKREEVIVYGSGEAKAVLNYEPDVAAYTIRAATDPRAANRILICRPQGNIVSQLELISGWEKKTGRALNKIHVPVEELIKLSESLPHPDNVRASILHSIFAIGKQMDFELTDNDLEASMLYPDYKYTPIDAVLDICLVDSSAIKLAKL